MLAAFCPVFFFAIVVYCAQAAGTAKRMPRIFLGGPLTQRCASRAATLTATAAAADGRRRRRRRTALGSAVRRLFIATSVTIMLLQVIVGDVSQERGERVGSESQPCSSKAAVYEDSSCLHGEEGGGGLRHVHVHAHAHCDVWAGAAYADLLYSLLYIPLYIKLL